MKNVLGALILLLLPAITSCTVYEEVQAIKTANYEQGKHKGARFCAQCHREIYNEWSTRSLHSVATTGESFKDYLNKFKANYILNTFIGDAVCYACHGEKNSAEGVNCEICHGTVIPTASIMETHERKYKPGLKDLREKDFCAKCHDISSPLSGDNLFTVQGEWSNSEAAAKGITCQDCHMKTGAGGSSYHGFDSAHRDVTIYAGDLKISNANLQFPNFSLAIENRVIAHAIPASGPTRIMVLEVRFLDSRGKELHSIKETFGKKFTLMPVAGLFPNSLVKNTQLQSGEVRVLDFTLPDSLQDKISKAVATLKFYGVSDEHQGDIRHAHWISEPVLMAEFVL